MVWAETVCGRKRSCLVREASTGPEMGGDNPHTATIIPSTRDRVWKIQLHRNVFLEALNKSM